MYTYVNVSGFSFFIHIPLYQILKAPIPPHPTTPNQLRLIIVAFEFNASCTIPRIMNCLHDLHLHIHTLISHFLVGRRRWRYVPWPASLNLYIIKSSANFVTVTFILRVRRITIHKLAAKATQTLGCIYIYKYPQKCLWRTSKLLWTSTPQRVVLVDREGEV